MGTVYNGAAKRSAKQMKSLAKFSQAQKNTIDHRFAQFHSWHRQQHLPLYSKFLTDIADHLDTNQSVSPTVTGAWIQAANQFSIELRRCNPLNGSAEFLSSLSDAQVTSVARERTKTHTERVQKYQRETKQQRALRRHKEITTWASRAGIKVNKQQKALLTETLNRQLSLGSQRYYLQEQWIARFNQLLENRNQSTADFIRALNIHIESLWTLTQDNYPSEWQDSATLWQNFLTKFMQLQTEKQNAKLIEKARKLATTLEALSKQTKDTVSPRCFSLSR